MTDRLFVAVIGGRRAGKSTTWNTLFGTEVRTGKEQRTLNLGRGRKTDVFLISGSNEERHQYAGAVLANVDARIVLCSVQYTWGAYESTWEYVFNQGFQIYAQWLNPGYDGGESFDHLGLMNILLSRRAVVTMRSGVKARWRLTSRVEEIRQFIDGWATARGLAR